MRRALRSLSIAVAMLAIGAGTAVAQKKADATAAFQRGQALKKEGKTEEACIAFAQSMQLDPQFGTQYNLALCYLDLGRTASAWAELNELASKDTNAKRKADAARRVRALDTTLCRISITLADHPAELVVLRDDVDVTILLGTAFAVDPGPHRVVARAPGRREWSTEIRVADPGKTVAVEIPALSPIEPAAGPSAPDPGAGAVPVGPSVPERIDAPPPVARPGRTRRILGIATAGVGLVGIGLGTVYGFKAMSTGDKARDACGGDLDPCTGNAAMAADLIDDARGQARISDIGLIAGGALFATGVILYLTAPSGVTAAPVATPDTVGVVLSAGF